MDLGRRSCVSVAAEHFILRTMWGQISTVTGGGGGGGIRSIFFISPSLPVIWRRKSARWERPSAVQIKYESLIFSNDLKKEFSYSFSVKSLYDDTQFVFEQKEYVPGMESYHLNSFYRSTNVLLSEDQPTLTSWEWMNSSSDWS
jgi:hypothetical protein